MLHDFKKHIETQFPHLRERPFLLACSAGIDSTVLAHLCHRAGLHFHMAHCNFKLRGEESDEDEQFVIDLSKQIKRPIHVTHFDTEGYRTINKVSLQMAARELRYRWFETILQENDLETLVTAHHADDDLESFLINLSRGTGIDGLLGIPSKTESIARPLLKFSRTAILNYAQSEGILWREESSNAGTKYLRNAIRHKIVPLLKDLNPTFLENFKKTQDYLGETAVLADNHIHELRAAIFEPHGGDIRVKIEALQRLTPLKAYLYALFKEFGFTEWDDVQQLLTAPSGKQLYSPLYRLVKDRDYLILTKIGDGGFETHWIQEGDSEIVHPIRLSIKAVKTFEEQGKNVLYLDKIALKYPMTLRKWEKGDYFYPLGMMGKKKLSKYFKDEKVDIISKENQWLLCSDHQIVWVIGKRADDRFKIKEGTTAILQIKYLP